VPELQRLAEQHAPALLRFEQDNRAFFARSVPDRGDAYFAEFDIRHAHLLAEQAAGQHHFHVLVDDDGAVLGRFNLVDVADGSAELDSGSPSGSPARVSPRTASVASVGSPGTTMDWTG